jgi:hypothetical protein
VGLPGGGAACLQDSPAWGGAQQRTAITSAEEGRKETNTRSIQGHNLQPSLQNLGPKCRPSAKARGGGCPANRQRHWGVQGSYLRVHESLALTKREVRGKGQAGGKRPSPVSVEQGQQHQRGRVSEVV